MERSRRGLNLLWSGYRYATNVRVGGQSLQSCGGLALIINGRHGGNRCHADAPLYSLFCKTHRNSDWAMLGDLRSSWALVLCH